MPSSWCSSTTKIAPFKLIMGHVPRAHQALRSSVADLEPHLEKVMRLRWNTIKTIKHAQELLWGKKGKNFQEYHKEDKVWVEGTNIKTTHPSAKLAPRWHRPFTIIDVISPVVYHLELPTQWKIHNIFHVQLLSPYHETAMHGPNFLEPPPDIIDGNEEWEVREILKERKHGAHKKNQFRVC